MKNSFIIYNKYEELFDMLSAKEQGKLIKIMFAFSKGDDIVPIEQSMEKATQMAWITIKTDMKNDALKYQAKCDKLRQNGAKGGIAKAENNALENDFSKCYQMPQNASKNKQMVANARNEQNQEEFRGKTEENCSINEENNPENPSKCYQMVANGSKCPQIESDYDNEYDYDNDNNSLLVNNKLKNNKYNKQCVRACEGFNSSDDFINAFEGIKEWFSFHTSEADDYRELGMRVIKAMIVAYDRATESSFRFGFKKWDCEKILENYNNITSEIFGKIVSQIRFNEDIENETLYIWGCLFK